MTEPAQRGYCGAKTRAGGTCGHQAGWGTSSTFGRCKLHGGATPSGRTFAARQQATAEAARLGLAVETDPHEALAIGAGILGGQVAALQRLAGDIEDGQIITSGDLNPTLRALNAVIDQWNRANKTCIDAGIEERRLKLDGLVLDGLAGYLRAVLDGLQLTPEQEAKIAGLMERHAPMLDALGDRPRELAA